MVYINYVHVYTMSKMYSLNESLSSSPWEFKAFHSYGFTSRWRGKLIAWPVYLYYIMISPTLDGHLAYLLMGI